MRCMTMVPVLTLLLSPAHLFAQFEVQHSTTTADLRGIASVGGGVAWASGTRGTVLRTEDGGRLWQACAVPPGAEALDFRGVQASDARTALVMSSGPGALSRVYRTTDGCRTWRLVFTNPDPEGFFDAIQSLSLARTVVAGDPVGGVFPLFTLPDAAGGDVRRSGIAAIGAEAMFASSNSSLLLANPLDACVVTGGARTEFVCRQGSGGGVFRSPIPIAATESGGAFAVQRNPASTSMVVVGGDYRTPNGSRGVAAWSTDGRAWLPALTQPHGYRSSVAFDAALNSWIAVGPNGTDVSGDDGRNWEALRPGRGDQPDADQQWNALSLPFVVGPAGRIGRLREGVLHNGGPR